MIEKNELEGSRCSLILILSQDLPGGTEETTKTSARIVGA
jgi:hypothetical protein